MTPDARCRSWPEMDTNRGRVLFVMVDSAGKYGDMYRQLFPDLRNATFFVSQPGEPHDCSHSLAVCTLQLHSGPKKVHLHTSSLSILDGIVRNLTGLLRSA